jgi:hypothetical protein
MTEQELRALVRSVIAQRAGGALTAPGTAGAASLPVRQSADSLARHCQEATSHASHALFILPAPGDACIIEPAVTCNHCGYCKSYGH